MKTMLAVFILTVSAYAQQYPRWFLFPDELVCPNTTVSVQRAPSLHKDSAVAAGFRAACFLSSRYTALRITGGQAFWRTEAGVHSMGAKYSELFDSSLADQYQSSLRVIDAYSDKDKLIVLAGDVSACSVSREMMNVVPISSVKEPHWIEMIPNDNEYYYGAGTSEGYFYESSSWERAEHNSVMSLARTVGSKVVSMQKRSSIESQEIMNEEVNVELRNVRIAARWRDVKKNVFYVLAKVRRQ